MSEHEKDVVVVGGRCAGAATAMLLARRGYSVSIRPEPATRSRTVVETSSCPGRPRAACECRGKVPYSSAQRTPDIVRTDDAAGSVVSTYFFFNSLSRIA
jgi:flavin-dependent dehydrogenase